MTRRHLHFTCESDNLVATLDDAAGQIGLLLVTGGNETRAGAFGGQAQLAARLADAGYAVFRFDRRGVGDSEGENRGFTGSGPDIAAAIGAFRGAKPELKRVVGFGNCDAASALLLNHGAACDALVLANPWTLEGADDGPPPDAIRSRYARKLKNPREILRLLSGGVSLRKLAGGITNALRPPPPPTSLAQEMRDGLAGFSGPSKILLAANDRTAQAFKSAWPECPAELCPNAGHSFSEDHAREWLFNHLSATLDEQARQFDMG